MNCISCYSVVPSSPAVIVNSTSATSISFSWSVPSDSLVTSYTVMWERDVRVDCPVNVTGLATQIIPTHYDVMALEEDSSYIITVVAINLAGSSEASKSVVSVTGEAGETLFCVKGCPSNSLRLNHV